MSDHIRIRVGIPDDADFVVRMGYLAGFPFANGSNPPFEEAMRVPWIQQYIGDWGKGEGDYGLIAEDDSGHAVGAAWYRFYEKKNAGTLIPTAELSIGVSEAMQGRGVGEKLLSALIAAAKDHGVEHFGLQVEPRNVRAKALYEKLGFAVVGKSDSGYDVMTILLARE